MAFATKISEEAQLDLHESRQYYSKISKNLEQKFLSEIVEVVDTISLNPDLYQHRYRNVKIAVTRSFPFGIHYIFESNTIFIQRILHQKRFYK